jgi:hypothetical protein
MRNGNGRSAMVKLTPEEAREKKHNPWYCKVCRKLVYIAYGFYYDLKADKEYEIPYCPVCDSSEVVEKLERETPEEFENRTGRPWGDDSAVYMKINKSDWQIRPYWQAKRYVRFCDAHDLPCIILCANSDSGIPGPSEYVVLENQKEVEDIAGKAGQYEGEG